MRREGILGRNGRGAASGARSRVCPRDERADASRRQRENRQERLSKGGDQRLIFLPARVAFVESLRLSSRPIRKRRLVMATAVLFIGWNRPHNHNDPEKAFGWLV